MFLSLLWLGWIVSFFDTGNVGLRLPPFLLNDFVPIVERTLLPFYAILQHRFVEDLLKADATPGVATVFLEEILILGNL